MTRSRISETDQGIRGQLTVEIYDQMQRRLRDKGWIETRDIARCGITHGLALEIGLGPGYLGLEPSWGTPFHAMADSGIYLPE